jgi:hypothetical protein
MSEQEVRDGLAALVVDEPPLAFDPDALMAKADAAVRRRRTLVGAGSATLVIAAAAVALPITLRGGGGGGSAPSAIGQATPGSAPVVVTTPAKPTYKWPPAHYETPSYTVQGIENQAHKLQSEAKAIFPREVAKATDVKADLFQGEAQGDYHAGQLSLNGAVHYTTNQGNAAVEIEVFAGASAPAPADACVNDADQDCELKLMPGGAALLISNWRQGDLQARTVRHYRPDGVVVSVTGYNTDGFARERVPYLSTIPISGKGLTEIATDPDLTL